MDEEKKINIQFKFNEIATLKYFIDNRPDAVRDLKTEGYKFDISGANFVNAEHEILGFDIIVNISTNDDKNIKVCELFERVSFYINNFKEVVQLKDKTVTINDKILYHLFSISLSSVRGVLHEKLVGSIISGLIMPPINVKDFIADMKTPK